MKLLWRIVIGLFVIAVFIPPLATGGTSDVFRLQSTINGVIQLGSSKSVTNKVGTTGNKTNVVVTTGSTVIHKVIITSDDLLNLASQRKLGTEIPKNEILALVNDCSTNNLRLIVFDSTAASNLLTIGTFSDLAVADSTRKKLRETITQMTIPDISAGQSNGITGGSFYLHGKIDIDTNNCPTSFGGQLTGLLGTAFPFTATNIFGTNFVISCVTNCVDTNCTTTCSNRTDVITNIFPSVEAFNVIITHTPITTGKSIGTLIEP